MLNSLRRLKRKVLRSWPPRGAGVLIYHHIGPKNIFIKHLEITLSEEVFERQIEYIVQNFNVVPFSKIPQYAKDEKTIAVTFDDGYKSILHTALPILEKYECPFKIFLNSSSVEGELNWLNKLSVLLENLSAEQLPDLAAKATSSMREDLCNRAYIYWSSFVSDRTVKVISEYYDKLNAPEGSSDLYLSTDDIHKMSAHPLIEWGGHGRHHYTLDQLDDSLLKDEILGDYAQLQKILGNKLQGFAVPFGTAKFRLERFAEIISQIDQYFVTATGERVRSLKVGTLSELSRVSMYPGVEELKTIFLNRPDLLPVNV